MGGRGVVELLLAEVGDDPGAQGVPEDVDGRAEPVEQPVHRHDE